MPTRPASNAAREALQWYGLFAITIACALIVCVLPRTLAPVELPGLVLSSDAVAAVLAADHAAQAQAPHTPAALALAQLELEHGEAEDRAIEGVEQYRRRRQTLRQTYATIVAESGASAALALRALAVAKLEDALALRLPEAQLKGVLGVFPNALAAYGITHDGAELAPHFVLRTLYKTRWNMMLGLPPDYAFAPVEKLSYHGYLALYADNMSAAERIRSLERYAAAGGEHLTEAHGELLFLDKQYAMSAAALDAAYEQNHSLRIRNYAQGARFAAGIGQ